MGELETAKEPMEKGKNMVREVRTTLDKANHDLCGLRELLDPATNTELLHHPSWACNVRELNWFAVRRGVCVGSPHHG